jgi:HPt (histidine-containing phosphotransfer) domain-containing protein
MSEPDSDLSAAAEINGAQAEGVSGGLVRETMQASSIRRRPSLYVTRAELLDTLQSGDDFVDEVVAMFLKRFPVLIGEIRSAFEDHDVVAVSRAAHSLAGSIAHFDESQTCEAARRIERLTAFEFASVPAALHELEQRLAELSQYLTGEFAPARARPQMRQSRAARGA